MTDETRKKLSMMSGMEQLEWMSIEATRLHMSVGMYTEKYGHLIPPPKSATAEEKPRKERIKTCARCGNLFSSWKGHSDYCPDCRIEVRREKENAWKAKQRAERKATRQAFKVRVPKIYHKVCEICGKAIETTSAQTKFCPECAKARTRERVRANNRRVYAEKKEKMKNEQGQKTGNI